MELKSPAVNLAMRSKRSSNRTFMELKYMSIYADANGN